MGKNENRPINVARLQELFDYDEEGFRWKVNKGRAKVGDRAHTNSAGYKVLKFDGLSCLEHRLVWAWHHGSCPEILDHIDNNPQNNRIENLREATYTENGRNRSIHKNNKSGVKGVHWCASKNKWKAMLTFDGKQKCVGRFFDLSEAANAVASARLEHHGQFSNHGEINA